MTIRKFCLKIKMFAQMVQEEVLLGCVAWWLSTCTWKQRFPVHIWLLAMCRGELCAVIAWLMSKCLVKWVEVVVRS